MKENILNKWKILLLLFVFFSKLSISQRLSEITNMADSSWLEFKGELNINPVSIFQSNKTAFGLGTNDEMIIKTAKTDELGFTHYRYQQKYMGIDVEGGQYSIHAKNGTSHTGTGRIIKNITIDAVPSIDSVVVIQYAVDEVRKIEAEKYGVLPLTITLLFDSLYPANAELIISKLSSESWDSQNFKLLYKVKVKIFEPSDFSYYVYVDAKTGSVIETIPGVFFGTGYVTSLYNGYRAIETKWTGSITKYRLQDETRGSGDGITTRKKRSGADQYVNDNDNIWDDDDKSKIHASTHWAAEKVWDFFTNEFGRSGPHGNGGGLDIITNQDFNGAISNSSLPGSDPLEMNFSKAVENKCNSRVSLGDVGHEFTHGVGYTEASWEPSTSFTSSTEAYAIMEGYCDIFGELVENNVVGWVDWKYDAESILDNAYLRTFSPPVVDGVSALEYGDANWNANTDGHQRGGVLRYWFYLISGGNGDVRIMNGTNHLGNTFCIRRIGIPKISQLLYKVLNDGYLSTSSTFLTMRNATIQVAKYLYGNNSPEVAEITQAWYAVAVGSAFTGIIELNDNNYQSNDFYYYGYSEDFISFNNEIIFNNFHPFSGLTITSNTRITITTSSSISSGSYFHAYIAPSVCNGSAKMGNPAGNDNYGGDNIVTKTQSENKPISINNTQPTIILQPNPTSGKVAVAAIGGIISSIEVLNVFGERIIYLTPYLQNPTFNEIDFSTQSKGLYFVKVQSGDKCYVHKVMYQ